MEKRSDQERKNKRIGWIISVGVQLVLLILFYFIVAWREPIPPNPVYGIEIGFLASGGSVAEVSESETVEEIIQSQTEPAVQEQETTDSEEVSDSQAEVNETPAEVSQTVPTQEVSPDVQEETQEVEQEPIQEEPLIDERALMAPASTGDKEQNSEQSASEGDREIDPRSLYGNQGSSSGNSEGANLSLGGWTWNTKPEPDDQSDESGSITYRIEVDQNGYLIRIQPISSSVSPAVERKYREAVRKITFSQTTNTPAPEVSVGTITFIIQAK